MNINVSEVVKKANIDSGQNIPSEVVVDLIKTEMVRNGWAEKRFLIDGFPRNMADLFTWIKTFGKAVDVKFMLNLDCCEASILERVTGEE